MLNNNATLYGMLTLTSILLAGLIFVHFKEIKEYEKYQTSFTQIQPPHTLEVFIMNFFYHHIKPKLYYKKNQLKPFFNDYVNQPDDSFDLFYIPKRRHYCHANFLYTMLNYKNLFLDSNFIFMDYTNKHSLKKELSVNFDFLNTSVHKQDQYQKKLIKRLQNMDWNPKIKLFFTSANFNYNNQLGRTHLCMFQMSNHIPGTGVLHRQDLLVDMLRKFSVQKVNHPCQKVSNFFPKTFRLYNQNECNQFFDLIKTKQFKKKMKTKILFIFQNVESHQDQIIDFIEIQKLNKIYNKGTLCGQLKKKFMIQEYVGDQIKYKNGRKFVLRVFYYVTSTKPLIAFFNKGYVLLERYSKKSSFSKAMISYEQLMKYFNKNNIMNDYTFTIIMNRIKKIVAFLNFLANKNFLRDPRFYQTIAMDFVIDSSFQPKLVGIKGSPEFVKKNIKFVKSILNIQNQVLNIRSSKIFDFFYNLKQEVYSMFNEDFKIESIEDFIFLLSKNFKFNKLKKSFITVNSNNLPSLKNKLFEEFDLIYDERRPGKLVYKGLLKNYCLDYAKI